MSLRHNKFAELTKGWNIAVIKTIYNNILTVYEFFERPQIKQLKFSKNIMNKVDQIVLTNQIKPNFKFLASV